MDRIVPYENKLEKNKPETKNSVKYKKDGKKNCANSAWQNIWAEEEDQESVPSKAAAGGWVMERVLVRAV